MTDLGKEKDEGPPAKSGGSEASSIFQKEISGSRIANMSALGRAPQNMNQKQGGRIVDYTAIRKQ